MTITDITIIRNKIMEQINNSQEIKRLIMYLTRTPLELTGQGLSGNIKQQPNILTDLISHTIRILPFTNKNLYENNNVSIVVSRQSCSLTDEENATLNIQIICPKIYSQLNQNEDRESSIADEIITILGTIEEIIDVNAIDSTPIEHEDYNILTLFLTYQGMY